MPSSTSPATPLPVQAPARRWGRHVQMLLLALLLPLLWHVTPQYEVANTTIAPLTPALALALAGTARMGWRALPAVIVGIALAVWAWPSGDSAVAVGPSFDGAVLLLQAAFGGLLMRRSSRSDDLALDSNPAIRRLVAVALATGMLGAVAEVLADLLVPGTALTRPGVAALVRGTADAATVLLLVPVILAFIAPQRNRWLARRRSVALPLGVLSLLLLGALAAIDERDRQHAFARFESDADAVFARTQSLLDAPVQAVLAIHGAMQTTATPLSGTAFDSLARPWLARSSGVADIGWLDAPRGDSGAPSVKHLLAAQAGATGAPAAAGDTLAAAEPLRATLNKATTQDSVVVSPVVAPASAETRTAFVIYRALIGDNGSGQRQVVFATVLIDRLLTPLVATRSDALQACVFDADPRVERRRLYGPLSCETAAPRDNTFNREAGFEFAGRKWAMRISQPIRTQSGAWLFALPALAGGGLLAALLLTLTGRVQRIEDEARLRSLDMQRDIDQLRAQLQRQERSMDGVFDAVQSGIALIEPDGRIQRVNTAFADLVGSTPADLRRRPIDELLQDDDHPGHARIVSLLQQADDELQHSSMRLRLADKRVLPALLTLRVLRERDGRTGAAVCSVHDLSESLRRRQAERVLGDVLESGLATSPMPLTPAGTAPPATSGAMTGALTGTMPGGLGSSSAASSSATAIAGAPQRILCIHADADRPEFLATAFADRPQVQLRYATTAAEGLVRAETDAPHLVLLDLALPDGDGLEILQQLNSDPRTRAIPVIVLSDDPRPDRIDAAFSAGARSYLSQPLDARQLLAAIDELI